MPYDLEMLSLAQSRTVPVHLLLTKADKLSRSAGVAACAAIRRAIGEDATVQLFSAHAGTGVLEARSALERLLAATSEKETPAEPADPAGAGKPGVGG
jgi:GTP-binding protein